jgi:hypothetical protein
MGARCFHRLPLHVQVAEVGHHDGGFAAAFIHPLNLYRRHMSGRSPAMWSLQAIVVLLALLAATAVQAGDWRLHAKCSACRVVAVSSQAARPCRRASGAAGSEVAAVQAARLQATSAQAAIMPGRFELNSSRKSDICSSCNLGSSFHVRRTNWKRGWRLSSRATTWTCGTDWTRTASGTARCWTTS